MTNEQEIVWSVFGVYLNDLKAYSTKPDRPTFKRLEEVRDRAIKALEQQPTTKNVLNQLKDEIHDKGFNSPLMNPIFTYTEIIEMIDKYITDIELQENEEEGGDSK